MNFADRPKTATITAEQRERLKEVAKLIIVNDNDDDFEQGMTLSEKLGEEVGIGSFDPLTAIRALSVEPGVEFNVASFEELLSEALSSDDHAASMEDKVRELVG